MSTFTITTQLEFRVDANSEEAALEILSSVALDDVIADAVYPSGWTTFTEQEIELLLRRASLMPSVRAKLEAMRELVAVEYVGHSDYEPERI
jgi:hypothetical protein